MHVRVTVYVYFTANDSETYISGIDSRNNYSLSCSNSSSDGSAIEPIEETKTAGDQVSQASLVQGSSLSTCGHGHQPDDKILVDGFVIVECELVNCIMLCSYICINL